MEKFGRRNSKNFKGRQFLSIQMVKDVFELRRRGVKEEEIEKRLGLARGVVRAVEGGGVVRAVGEVKVRNVGTQRERETQRQT